MADITRSGVSLATTAPPTNCKLTLPAAAALTAGDVVYINSSGQFAQADGSADDALAEVFGVIVQDVAAGEAITAFHSVEVNYATGLTPGDRYFLSATAATLADAATTGGDVPIAFATSTTRIYVMPPQK